MDDIEKLKQEFGEALLVARGRLGFTQAEAASRAGLSTAVYGRIERGQMLPSVPTLFRLCATLRVSSDALLGLDAAGRTALSTAAMPGETPELRRLAGLARRLSPSALRTLTAVACAVAR